MAETATADIPRSDDTEKATASSDTGGTFVRRLVPATDRHTNTAPKTPDELIKALYEGYVFATPEQFAECLDDGTFQIWKAGNIYALVEFIDTSYGKTLNVLTVTGNKEDFDIGIAALEPIARMNGAKLIYSVGHLGWEKAMQRHGYTTERVLRMKKVLT